MAGIGLRPLLVTIFPPPGLLQATTQSSTAKPTHKRNPLITPFTTLFSILYIF